jgi:hypothetical protein
MIICESSRECMINNFLSLVVDPFSCVSPIFFSTTMDLINHSRGKIFIQCMMHYKCYASLDTTSLHIFIEKDRS